MMEAIGFSETRHNLSEDGILAPETGSVGGIRSLQQPICDICVHVFTWACLKPTLWNYARTVHLVHIGTTAVLCCAPDVVV
jgi:hypothetical protein